MRVHCASLGCPIAGDPIYGNNHGTLALLSRALALPLTPPAAATAPVPPHMRALMHADPVLASPARKPAGPARPQSFVTFPIEPDTQRHGPNANLSLTARSGRLTKEYGHEVQTLDRRRRRCLRAQRRRRHGPTRAATGTAAKAWKSCTASTLTDAQKEQARSIEKASWAQNKPADGADARRA